MATNYTFAQVVQVYADGTNRELMVEIGRRYPLLMARVSKLIALAGDEFIAFATSMPEHITANKLNKAMLEACGDAADDEDGEEEESSADEATDEAGDEDLSTKTTKELYSMCIKKGLKVSKYGKPKSYYIDALTGASESADESDEEEEKPVEKASKSSKKAAKAEPEDDGEDDEGDEDPYAGKSAMELFKECKKRGIKTAPKKPAKHYAELLKKNDEEQAAAADDDDWGDDGEDEAPAKPAKKSGSKKQAEQDDDEDWDI